MDSILRPRGAKIAVFGERNTGKSTLISSFVSRRFSETVSSVVKPLKFPKGLSGDVSTSLLPKFYTLKPEEPTFNVPYVHGLLPKVPFTVVDTESLASYENEVFFPEADVVLVTYDCGRLHTAERLFTNFRKIQFQYGERIPLVLVGCKADLDKENWSMDLSQYAAFVKFDSHIRCSASTYSQVDDVFHLAVGTAVYPRFPIWGPLLLTSQFIRALEHIFRQHYDRGVSVAHFIDFMKKGFNVVLGREEAVCVFRKLDEFATQYVAGGSRSLPELNDGSVDQLSQIRLTSTGFVRFCDKYCLARHEISWTLIKSFGLVKRFRYQHFDLPPFRHSSDQSVELTDDAIDFIWKEFSNDESFVNTVSLPRLGMDELGMDELFGGDDPKSFPDLDYAILAPGGMFDAFYSWDNDDIGPGNEGIFRIVRDSLFEDTPYANAVQTTSSGRVSMHSFLLQWALITLLDPDTSLAWLSAIGYPFDDLQHAFRITQPRSLEFVDRKVLQCFVFGPKMSGKSQLLHNFVGRGFCESYSPTIDHLYVINYISMRPYQVESKILVLREIPECLVGELLSSEESFAACDVAVFVYDSSDSSSWMGAMSMRVKVAGRFKVPCLLVAAKSDLSSFIDTKQQSAHKCTGIEDPIPISTKLGDLKDVFRTIVAAAGYPHSGIIKVPTNSTDSPAD